MKKPIICICGPVYKYHSAQRVNGFRLVAECEGFVALTSTAIEEVAPLGDWLCMKGVDDDESDYRHCPALTMALKAELFHVLEQKILLSDVVFFLEYPHKYEVEREYFVAFAEKNGKRIEFAENQKIGIKDFQEEGFRAFLNKLRSEGDTEGER